MSCALLLLTYPLNLVLIVLNSRQSNAKAESYARQTLIFLRDPAVNVFSWQDATPFHIRTEPGESSPKKADGQVGCLPSLPYVDDGGDKPALDQSGDSLGQPLFFRRPILHICQQPTDFLPQLEPLSHTLQQGSAWVGKAAWTKRPEDLSRIHARRLFGIMFTPLAKVSLKTRQMDRWTAAFMAHLQTTEKLSRPDQLINGLPQLPTIVQRCRRPHPPFWRLAPPFPFRTSPPTKEQAGAWMNRQVAR
ncbi:hypothetical protein QBC46DRAFT_432278 [Diplogelasinospora grovesii]|uniref:Uncharacterized protein n=1 Tax=Diplogelasinospora grovesii TaxID=303347 RepID=A0AAN6N9B2_9PEZI|nr:hypothetical protein QBC46DRAFT_432278 [Diplogelasinospora grovesii]